MAGIRSPSSDRGLILPSLAWLAASICLLPMIAVAIAALTGGFDTWRHLIDTVLPGYTWNTVKLVLMVAVGSAIIGTSTAWLVTMTRFPGARSLEIALALPLALPAYVVAYAYTDFLDHPGAVQTLLRDVMGWGPRDYWFPEIRSLGGAAIVLTLVLYPYVYLLARAAFLQQGANAFHAARTLGHGAWGAFMRVNLPMARPAIAAGVLLALMETIADFGTVAHFGTQTFATGIYRAWFSLGDRAAAAQLGFCLLAVALLLALLERAQRGQALYHNVGRRVEVMAPMVLNSWGRWGAVAVCGLPVALGFVLPAVLLAFMSFRSEQNLLSGRYLDLIQNSLTLAGVAALVTVAAAVIIGFNARLNAGSGPRAASYIARLGYAVPGGVIAVGLLVPFAIFDNAVDAWMRATFGMSTGLLVTGSIWLLVLAYMVRFLAAALGTFESGLATVKPNLDAAARTLGRSPLGVLRAVHLPLLSPSMLTALLIVFVDVMKELPATLIMRPFNFDTLAVQAYRLAADERLAGAAVPSLVIAAIGLIPVIILCRRLGRR